MTEFDPFTLGRRAVVNIASITSPHPSTIGLAADDTSKVGVLMFTKSLALEITPHSISTEGTKQPLQGLGMTEAEQQAAMGDFVQCSLPLRRIGTPDEIALGW